ncbi:hypothetical protein [Rhizobium sp. N324]|uniref:hypothetical protein n=1 Tax=Rhizobium sp. N324 TaxID=1703969 RepID=UPI0007EBAA0A|nr:hypothetical protein [Rhizobium sp. N324]ANM12084.1 hypothetical protein AMK05_CH03735 [Rhizobium sp. N324]
MNHFTPFLPARISLADMLTSDDSCRNLEERMLDSMRMRVKTQRRAEAVLLLLTAFVFAFCFAARV